LAGRAAAHEASAVQVSADPQGGPGAVILHSQSSVHLQRAHLRLQDELRPGLPQQQRPGEGNVSEPLPVADVQEEPTVQHLGVRGLVSAEENLQIEEGESGDRGRRICR
jgi:hypothetical protein